MPHLAIRVARSDVAARDAVPSPWGHHMIKFIGALVLMLGAMGGAMAQTATPVTITLTDYAFTPQTLELKVGAAYQLHFANSGSKEHNFSAPEFFAAVQIAPDDQAKLAKGQVGLGASQTVDI